MTERDFDRFSALMLGLAENFGRHLSPQGLALRFRALEARSIEDVEAAGMRLMLARRQASMPTVADFLETLDDGGEDRAAEEAGKVLTAIREHGGYSGVVFDDPVTQAVIVRAYGGWARLCAECGDGEALRWFRRDFAATWLAYRRRGIRVFGALPGRFGAEGLDASSGRPALIGDPERAKAVLLGNERPAPAALPPR